ncbi:CHAP domain-containing protein [Lactococcus allomyrinae]|uniref:CHAP domain-containing protein n=1 Tax=Lactococcus allomyrinae TaxID=2419773 RepID=A0A387BB97_9LACT|nr:CHAP domain-containing protein [Lactococcus allomyrinae]AYG01145.1 CHAP domain-containing protein [Lactococcus allomyrinae]
MKKFIIAAAAGGVVFLTVALLLISVVVEIGGGAVKIGQLNNGSSSSSTSSYVKDWSTGDPYTHNLLMHRYGITATQLDGYLKSTGIPYDPKRINGQLLLEWEKSSNLDVRAIIAIAQEESSLGTAGVATEPGANMFGYGAFDSNPENATQYNDAKAVVDLTSITIILNKNETFKTQDDKAKALAAGTWTPLMGGVYFTDTSGTGKRRADIMQKVDDWINAHGGTPAPPGGYGGGGAVDGSIASLEPFLGTVVPNTYGGGEHQCYAVSSYYAHSIDARIELNNGIAAADIGSDYNWKAWGWTVVTNPSYSDIKAGDIINFVRGTNMGSWNTSPEYGHTGVVAQVTGNNQIVVYDQGTMPFAKDTYTYHSGMVSSVVHPPNK